MTGTAVDAGNFDLLVPSCRQTQNAFSYKDGDLNKYSSYIKAFHKSNDILERYHSRSLTLLRSNYGELTTRKLSLCEANIPDLSVF